MPGSRTATTIWTIRPEVVLALDARLGPPIDSYVNGSQVWISPDGPGEIGVEWRLHPVAAYRAPKGLHHEGLWDAVAEQLATGADAAALALGDERRPLASVWDGLECFAAYGDEVEPAPLRLAVSERLGLDPDHAGLVDHEALGDDWERSDGAISLVAAAIAQLTAQA